MPFFSQWGFVCISWPTGNGAMPPFANNNNNPPPPGAPRDPAFGSIGRPNGRSPGNGAPPVTVAGPPTAAKSSVTISNGRDPRRAKRWNSGLWGIMWQNCGRPHLPLPSFFKIISPTSPSPPVLAFKIMNAVRDYLHHFYTDIQANSQICHLSCVVVLSKQHSVIVIYHSQDLI